MAEVLRVSNVEKIYGSGIRAFGLAKRGSKEGSTRALAGLSFSVDKGELVAIMGPSGSGKSTLLNCIATIDRPTAGEIVIGGVNVCSMKQKVLSEFRRTQLGFIFQDSNLLDTLTCRENICLPLSINRMGSSDTLRRAEAIAGALGVKEILDRFPYQISGGQKQRVAACRAMVNDPALILADEPTGALDSKNARLLLESFQALHERMNSTILMVTHDSFAASYCERVLFIRDGQIYSELRRGQQSRKVFFNQIMDVVASLGGGVENAL